MYLYVYQSLTTAQLRRDVGLVQEVIAVLEIERGTWRQVCDEMSHSPSQITERESGESQVVTPSGVDSGIGASPGSVSFDA